MHGVDQSCGNILTFAIGLYTPGNHDKAYKWFLSKFNEKCQILRKPIKTVICELNKTLIARIEKELPKVTILVSHFSVIQEFQTMLEDQIILSEDKQGCLEILKEVCNTENKSQCRELLGELNKSFSDSEKHPKYFEEKIFAFKHLWLPYKNSQIYTAGLENYTKLATIKEIFDCEVGQAPIIVGSLDQKVQKTPVS